MVLIGVTRSRHPSVVPVGKGGGGEMAEVRHRRGSVVTSDRIGVGAIARRPGILLGFQSLDWEHLVDDLPVGISICDAEGCLVQYNDHAASLWGRSPPIGSPDHLIGKGLKACRPEGEALSETPTAEVLRTGKPVRGRELVLER